MPAFPFPPLPRHALLGGSIRSAVLVGVIAMQRPSTVLGHSALCFALGLLVFSGSLYVLALGGVRWLGAITPIGGLLLLAGWALLGWAALKRL